MNLLEVSRLAKQFGGVRCLDDVSFRVHRGECVGVIGPNGAGKTTLFNLMTGYLTPTAGRVGFLGQDVTALPPHRRAALGMVRTFQTLNLFHEMSALENVMTGLQLRDRTPVWAAAAGLPLARRRYAEMRRQAAGWLEFVGMAKEADRPAGELSFGQQRLVDTARALATEPVLLLLDEPVSGLATHEKQAYARLLQQVRKSGVSVILVEHDMATVMSLCDRVLVLNSGTLIAAGPPARVQADPAVRAAYLGEGVV